MKMMHCFKTKDKAYFEKSITGRSIKLYFQSMMPQNQQFEGVVS